MGNMKLSPPMVRMLEAMGDNAGQALISGEGTLTTLTSGGVKIGTLATAFALVNRGLVKNRDRWTFRLTTSGRAALRTYASSYRTKGE